MNNFLLDFLAIRAIFSGILVITSKNPVISVLFLISVFVNIAGYLILLGVGFIGISYLIVYVGAIAILFLFVVMMLNLQIAELSSIGKEYTQNIPLGTIIRSLFIFELVSLLPISNLVWRPENRQSYISSYSNFFDTSNISYITADNNSVASLPNLYHGQSKTSIQIEEITPELGILNWLNHKFISLMPNILSNKVARGLAGGHINTINFYYENSDVQDSLDNVINYINNNSIRLTNDIHMRFYQYPQFTNFIQIESIGYLLYTNNRFWLILTSVILLLAMIGPITLSISNKNRA
uniref:NADH-ubiquinone oxidoreductase chain 6 n=2 Tax=Tilletia TaxID=13289 RepID=A8DU56_9BASI|nr:NADH dehydrogenase subunit 6 [Tilletia indica]YP_001876482.1 ND6 [Tilletia walkeri]ABI95820.1 NADH dehydrogenase subunit 6 [Tilletia indica]ABP03928.1 ND6 [Tilletia walkeri]APT42123.1 NADH dehydrogenase subunit 6 [Tilletia indica]